MLCKITKKNRIIIKPSFETSVFYIFFANLEENVIKWLQILNRKLDYSTTMIINYDSSFQD